ncbi:MAG: PspA/IM30 family protein [Janthinobacterium lividum]
MCFAEFLLILVDTGCADGTIILIAAGFVAGADALTLISAEGVGTPGAASTGTRVKVVRRATEVKPVLIECFWIFIVSSIITLRNRFMKVLLVYMKNKARLVVLVHFFRIDTYTENCYTFSMSNRSTQSLLGVLTGFLCVLPLLLRREKKVPVLSSEVLLQQAQQQMREAQAKNRTHTVDAITQKNNLQALVDQTQKTVTRLAERLADLDHSADEESRQSLLAEQSKYQETLTHLQDSLETAIFTTEAVKTAMHREEMQIREMTAEALALKAQEKQAQIEIAIARSQLTVTTNLATDLFVQARAKIQQTKARRDLMTQIAQTVETLNAAVQ